MRLAGAVSTLHSNGASISFFKSDVAEFARIRTTNKRAAGLSPPANTEKSPCKSRPSACGLAQPAATKIRPNLASRLSSRTSAAMIWFAPPPRPPCNGAARPRRLFPLMGIKMKVLVVDVGGTHVKILAAGEKEPRKSDSGPKLTAKQMVDGVKN